MTCRECFHWEACKSVLENATGFKLPEDFKGGAERCDLFVSTADVVEVVRCKDCKYWKGEKKADPITNYHYGDCTHEEWRDAEGWDKTTCGHEFCSRGERKEQK